MAADLTDNRIAVGMSMVIDRLAHISQKSPGFYLGKAFFHTLFRYVYQPLFFRAYPSDAEHTGRV